mmetsp:Transcript_19488/g.29078  ORF Transcript_19488/g.29078 Transcript_19488/m.29078 type:complete len:82 (+) Transcript_19488:3200-3445(+)
MISTPRGMPKYSGVRFWQRILKRAVCLEVFFTQAEEKETGEYGEDELTILNMMGKRISGNKREMEILFYSMHGARKFFRSG